jgi:hypothetical protein
MGRTDPDPECVCTPPDCTLTCEFCAEFGGCVPGFMKKDGPTEKDRRRLKYQRGKV